MDLQELYSASFVDWGTVAASWEKRTVSSRLLLFAAPPNPENPASRPWGEFVDAALAAELEMIPYGERPVLLGELRAGLAKAAEEAGPHTPLSRWFLARRDALPGGDLPENPEYLPV